ncbi:hypothetical protein SBA5_360029 [Candidatus Sulfotelmatomonas gaucii]|uniref:Uncharacterized protein n=1 Tax=Candidatus Sulfuritelmatomonas gaucii TaxID=2043161 RepID=A0A2N9LHR9_9BACT|nr:hypothetical protein SBA5_360029 [Candidatus Sulfotelmatomonas gaucii]
MAALAPSEEMKAAPLGGGDTAKRAEPPGGSLISTGETGDALCKDPVAIASKDAVDPDQPSTRQGGKRVKIS